MYLLTGSIFLLAMGVIFHCEVLEFVKNIGSFKDFEWIGILILIPAIYLVGHLFGAGTYWLLGAYKYIHEDKTDEKRRKKCLRKFCKRMKNTFAIKCVLLYGAKTTCAIERYCKKNQKDELFASTEDFWNECAVLQIEDDYAPAEYFYYVNELFQSLILIFGFSSIVAFARCHWIIGLVYIVLAFYSGFIARDHADRFVGEVVRTLKARKKIRQENTERAKAEEIT